MNWAKFICGDLAAFEEIYTEYVDDLFVYGIKYCADRDTVKDCIHDLFIQLFSNQNIAKEVNIKFYLFASLKRKLCKTKNSYKFVPYQEHTLEDRFAIESREIEIIMQESADNNTLRIKQEIDRLPKRQKEIIFLKYYMDFSYEEIAKLMNVSVSSCRTLSYRAMRELKGNLEAVPYATIIYVVALL